MSWGVYRQQGFIPRVSLHVIGLDIKLKDIESMGCNMFFACLLPNIPNSSRKIQKNTHTSKVCGGLV